MPEERAAGLRVPVAKKHEAPAPAKKPPHVMDVSMKKCSECAFYAGGEQAEDSVWAHIERQHGGRQPAPKGA